MYCGELVGGVESPRDKSGEVEVQGFEARARARDLSRIVLYHKVFTIEDSC